VDQGSSRFPKLFSPIEIGGLEIRNRIVFTAHHTHLADAVPTPEIAAYYEARARGGAGLIVVEASKIHESAHFAAHAIESFRPECIPGYRLIAEGVHRHGAKVLGQLFHPGREVRSKLDGIAQVAWAPSAVPGERHHVMPRAMPKSLIRSVIEGFAASARNICEAGLDGTEILASHGYLPAQFLSTRTNRRDDRYGGSLDNRLRFLRETIAAIRRETPGKVLGVRVSAAAHSPDGSDVDEMVEACRRLAADGTIDYLSLVVGAAATLGSSIHIVPPMEWDAAYVLPETGPIKRAVDLPVIVTGRINQPQVAEDMLARGEADMVGMTRAQIADPDMAGKVRAGRSDDIRACIGCNQACSGHGLLSMPISCIQNPVSGRETRWGSLPPASPARRVLVAGGGPAGLKAAAVAALRGHRVSLHEASRRWGGQALLAQRLPGREEFGGTVTNLVRECELAGVAMHLGSPVDAALVRREAPDAVIVATGARPYVPEIEGAGTAQIVTSWQVLNDEANVGGSVLVADSKGDWVAMGVAEKLARSGCRVRLAMSGLAPGETLQQYVRDSMAAKLHRLGVEVVPYARLCGVDDRTVFLQHIASEEPIVLEEIDTLVLSQGHSAVDGLEDELKGLAAAIVLAGDCRAPRAAEEAVYEGFQAALEL
jgi:2,4-dienoyl-CoA reductase-like NADH-dependent reductase (Old Yellow Enzyme family)